MQPRLFQWENSHVSLLFLDLIIFCCSFYLPSRIVLGGGLKEWEVKKTRGWWGGGGLISSAGCGGATFVLCLIWLLTMTQQEIKYGTEFKPTAKWATEEQSWRRSRSTANFSERKLFDSVLSKSLLSLPNIRPRPKSVFPNLCLIAHFIYV